MGHPMAGRQAGRGERGDAGQEKRERGGRDEMARGGGTQLGYNLMGWWRGNEKGEVEV